MIIHNQNLQKRIGKSANILLDTNVFSAAQRDKGFLEFLTRFRDEAGCAYATLPAIKFEVANGSNTAELYNDRLRFVDGLTNGFMLTLDTSKTANFSVVMAKLNANNNSHPDFQLAACMYQYRHTNIYLMTRDIDPFPDFFRKPYVVTSYSDGKGPIINFALYCFDYERYVAAAKKTLAA